jgi:uncharacterized protein (DUF1697 family)
MALVVFLRGVNVGGHKTFRPAALAKELAVLDVVNVGAAGTLVVRAAIGQTALKSELQRRLPFEADMMICRAADVLGLASAFRGVRIDKDLRRFVSVMAKAPRTLPRFPLTRPDGAQWQVKIVGVSGPFALSLWRRAGKTLIYPNEVVEKHFGVPTTTRNWNTIETVFSILGILNRGGFND